MSSRSTRGGQKNGAEDKEGTGESPGRRIDGGWTRTVPERTRRDERAQRECKRQKGIETGGSNEWNGLEKGGEWRAQNQESKRERKRKGSPQKGEERVVSRESFALSSGRAGPPHCFFWRCVCACSGSACLLIRTITRRPTGRDTSSGDLMRFCLGRLHHLFGLDSSSWGRFGRRSGCDERRGGGAQKRYEEQKRPGVHDWGCVGVCVCVREEGGLGGANERRRGGGYDGK